MKIRFAVILITLLFFIQKISAQTCPPNIDFEKGDFSDWECLTGITSVGIDGKNKISLSAGPPVPGRHQIITASSPVKRDPFGNFPVLCPYGGNYSVKLGNTGTGAEAEGLSYTFTVPTSVDTFTFTYFYAVVFEDPAHFHVEQPRFFVTAYDVLSGAVINCASYDYVSTGTIPGFERSTVNTGVLYKSWTPTSLQFAGLGGRSVRLEFKTADCTLGGHFGYAYIDVGSACSNILATAPYCRETNSLILNAPYGFQKYTWYNADFSQVVGSNQTLTLSPPPATSGIFNVDIEPYPGYGCRDTLQAVVTPLPVPDTPQVSDYTYCQFATAMPLEAIPSPGNELMWYTGDTTRPGTTKAPIPPTNTTGEKIYYVAQKILFGCESFRKKITVNVIPTPIASFTCNNTRQCENGNSFVFKSTSTNLQKTEFFWDFGDGSTLSSTKDTSLTHTYTKAGNYTIRLRVINAGTCSAERSMIVTVVPKPISKFSAPALVCQNQTTVNVNDQSFVPGGVAVINKWWWNFDGSILTTQNPNSFIPDKADSLLIKLVATSTEGCSSDTASVTIPVRNQPVSEFNCSKLLCNNEIIQFNDLSKLPPATSENIVRWDWQMGVSSNTSAQHPSLNLPPGVHKISLTTETNYGCRSKQKDSLITVHQKPAIGLDINDSCVFRTINYTALDHQNTVNKWHWNFGNGFIKQNAMVTKSYTVAGFNPLTLIGETINGCKDTLLRPFSIYDNKAFAGRDTIVAIDEPLQLNANGGSDVTYSWKPATGLNDAALESPVAILDRDQRYQLDALTKEGCDSHSSIMVKRYKGPDLYIPTGFTPNSDGKNDVLRVFPVGIKTFHYMAVYNRYGQQIFKTTDHTKGWDGTSGGIKLTTNTFVVVSEAIDYRRKPMVKKLTVTLIR